MVQHRVALRDLADDIIGADAKKQIGQHLQHATQLCIGRVQFL